MTKSLLSARDWKAFYEDEQLPGAEGPQGPAGACSSRRGPSRASRAEGLAGAKAYRWHGSGWAHQPEMNPR